MTSADWTKPSEGIEAQTYGRIGKKLERWRSALKMRRFEKKHKVEAIPIGASKDSLVKETNFQESESNAAKRAKGTAAAQQSGKGMADFRGQRTQKQRKQKWKDGA